MKKSRQDIDTIKQSFTDVIEDVDIFIEALEIRREKDLDKDLLLFDFIAGMEILKEGLAAFMDKQNADFNSYRLGRIFNNPLHKKVDDGIEILEGYEITHTPFPEDKMKIKEDLHSILDKIEKLK